MGLVGVLVVLWDLNARVGNEVIGGIVGEYAVPGRMNVTNECWRSMS